MSPPCGRRVCPHTTGQTWYTEGVGSTQGGWSPLDADAALFPADEFAWMDATEQAALVRRREVRAVQLVEAAIRRIERANPVLNAVVASLFDQALAQAEEIDHLLQRGPAPPFLGVPFLIKDLDDVAGAPTSKGSRYFFVRTAEADSDIAARFRRAGFILLGKTNTPELGLLPTTEPALFGPTRNPWALSRTPGGSSGGAAAAVAAGLVPAAHASDGGGSIRIPASCCGLFGLKPSRGRTPGDTVLGLTVHHALTRSVRDSARILDSIAGPPAWTPYPVAPPNRPFAAARLERRLRIGFSTHAPTGAPLHPEVTRAVQEAAALLERLGHTVEEAAPHFDGEEATERFMTLWAASCAAKVAERAAVRGRPPQGNELEPLTWALLEAGRRISAEQLLHAQGYLHRVARQIARFFETYDLWLTPTLAEPPLPLGSFDPASAASGGDPQRVFQRTNAWVPFTPIVNVTGQPAMSVPLAWSSDGLPIGMHFVGRFGDEATLFGLAYELEAERPWHKRTPPSCEKGAPPPAGN